jgi:hypothetical protein
LLSFFWWWCLSTAQILTEIFLLLKLCTACHGGKFVNCSILYHIIFGTPSSAYSESLRKNLKSVAELIQY